MNILHDKENTEFYVVIEDKRCLAHYTIIDEDTLDFDHTFVPKEFRGQGIAKRIFEEIVEYLEKNNLKVQASCSYAEKFFNKEEHKKYLKK